VSPNATPALLTLQLAIRMHAISSHLPKKTIPSMQMRRRTKKRYISTLLSPHNLLPRFYAASKRTNTKRSYQSWPQEEGNGTTEKRQIHVSQDISLKAGSTDERKKARSLLPFTVQPVGPLAQVKAQNSETEDPPWKLSRRLLSLAPSSKRRQ